jgi:hypothetical protein
LAVILDGLDIGFKLAGMCTPPCLAEFLQFVLYLSDLAKFPFRPAAARPASAGSCKHRFSNRFDHSIVIAASQSVLLHASLLNARVLLGANNIRHLRHVGLISPQSAAPHRT